MREILLELLEKLEEVMKENEEITDTVCRLKMSDAIRNGFLIPDQNYELPDDFGLYNSFGNNQVKQAIHNYIFSASAIADSKQMNFIERLNVFQDDSVHTASRYEFDDFFGWANPEEFNESGKWLGIKTQENSINERIKNVVNTNNCHDKVDGQLSLFDIGIIDKG